MFLKFNLFIPIKKLNNLHFKLKTIIIMSIQLQTFNINEINEFNESINKIKTQIIEKLIVLRISKINKLIELTSNYITEKEAYAILIHFGILLKYNIQKIPEFEKLCELTFDGFVKKFITIKECRHYDTTQHKDQIKSIIKDIFLGQDYRWHYLINESEMKTLKNTLLALQVFNRFANDYKIRVEDAIMVINELCKTVNNEI